MLRLPPIITQEHKKIFDNFYNKRADVQQALKPYLSAEEIAATMERIEAMHTHFAECKVVSTIDELVSQSPSKGVDSNNSYLARELFAFQRHGQGWNHLRKFRPF